MALLQDWQAIAYNQNQDPADYQRFWEHYFGLERDVYKQLLVATEPVKGTVKELAEKFNLTVMQMTGFLDGINESLKIANPIEEMDENTEVSLDFDDELLYKNMVAAKADWLFNLTEWEGRLTEERRKVLYKEQRLASTVVKGKKIGRNDPCPCGSGKKYKHCHGKNA